jgi:uracil-DNA glycosylase family 4
VAPAWTTVGWVWLDRVLDRVLNRASTDGLISPSSQNLTRGKLAPALSRRQRWHRLAGRGDGRQCGGMATRPDPELEAALAALARGLAGVVQVAGLTELPRPQFGNAPEAARRGADTAGATTGRAAQPVAPVAPVAASLVPAAQAAQAAQAAPAASAAAAAFAPVRPTRAPRAPSPAAPAASVVPSSAAPAAPLTAQGAALRVLQTETVGDCTRCKLHRGRHKLVFGAGNPQAQLVFVGEGPGEDEDRQGEPFVGSAGALLTKMIEAMGHSRDAVYIATVVKCRPPNNRDPERDEVDACEGFLQAQLRIIQPRVIVSLGEVAVRTLLRTQKPISMLRGVFHSYQGIPLMPTYHPADLLREELAPKKTKKWEAWSDLQQVMALLAEGDG